MLLADNNSSRSACTAARSAWRAVTSAAVAAVAKSAWIASTSEDKEARLASSPERSIAEAAFWAAVTPAWRPLMVEDSEATCPDKAAKPSTWDFNALIWAFKSSNWSS